MIYTDLTRKAMCIAYDAHQGQTDKSGIPYIFHPLHLAEQMEDEYTTCVALLHDCVEDTDIDLEDLAAEFPEQIVEAVAMMTHEDDLSYMDYVRRLGGNLLARKVKLADLAHNMDTTRLAGQSNEGDEKTKRRHAKYREALAYLNSL